MTDYSKEIPDCGKQFFSKIIQHLCFSTCSHLLCILVSLQSEQLVDLLLNTIMLSVPISGGHSHNYLSFSHGEYFYSLFHMTINTELLRSLDTTVPRLLKASSLNPGTVANLITRSLLIFTSVLTRLYKTHRNSQANIKESHLCGVSGKNGK